MHLRWLPLLSLICGLACVGAAQPSACTLTEIAVGVADFQGQPFRGLNENDFVDRAAKGRTYNTIWTIPSCSNRVRQSAKVVFNMIASFYRMQLEHSPASPMKKT